MVGHAIRSCIEKPRKESMQSEALKQNLSMVGIGWGFQPTTNKWGRRIMFDAVKFGQLVFGFTDNGSHNFMESFLVMYM